MKRFANRLNAYLIPLLLAVLVSLNSCAMDDAPRENKKDPLSPEYTEQGTGNGTTTGNNTWGSNWGQMIWGP